MRPAQHHPQAQIRFAEVGTICPREVCTPEIRFQNNCSAEVCLTEVCTLKIRTHKAHPPQIRLVQVRLGEIRSGEVRTRKVRAYQLHTGKVWLYFGLLFAPAIPRIYTLLEDTKMIPVCH